MVRRMTALLMALLPLVFPGAASAGDGYLNAVALTAASPPDTICYFDKDAEGFTYADTSRYEVPGWSICNGATIPIDIRLYTKAAPAWAGSFSADVDLDYVTLPLAAGQCFTPDPGITLIGWHLETTPTVDSAVTLVGWRRP